MTRHPVVTTSSAHRDLIEILNYLGDRSSTAGARFLDRYEAAVELIRTVPTAGHERRDVKSQGVRFVSFFRYQIAYTFDGERIVVRRVIHGARDYGEQRFD